MGKMDKMENFFKNTEQKIIQGLDEKMSPSLVVAIGDRDGVYYKKAFGFERVILDDTAPTGVFNGEIPKNAPMASTETMYDMASLSKLISTTMVTLKLIEQGEITLCDTVGRILPDAPEDKRGISVFQLLTHSSGIKSHFHLSSLCADKDGILDAILNYPLAYKAQTKTEYSCMGFILLAHLLQKATGKRLDDLAQQLVFDELKMNRTCYNPLDCEKMRGASFAATEYSPELKRYLQGEVHDENARFGGGVSGNAGVFSCADDMIKFAKMLSGKGEIDGKYYLTPSTFATAVRNHTPFGPEYRGLGFDLSVDYRSSSGGLYAPLSYGHNGFTGPSLYVDSATGMFTLILSNRVHYTRSNTKHLRFRRMLHSVALCEYERMKKEITV